MDTTSREHTPPDHTLRVLVRIDTRQGLASLEVRGRLTPETYPILINILAETGALGAKVSVNLLRTAHLDADTLGLLLDSADQIVHSGPDRPASPVEILVPPAVPVPDPQPALEQPPWEQPAVDQGTPPQPLTNEDAAELAFHHRDPRVLADRTGFRPPGF